jgi:hypothetical protein
MQFTINLFGVHTSNSTEIYYFINKTNKAIVLLLFLSNNIESNTN